MSFRIGIDARMIGPVMTGLGRYALGLVTHLPPLDPGNRYVVIHRAHAPLPATLPPNAETAVVEGDIDQPANLFVGRAIGRLGLDLYHSLYDFVPPGLRVPHIVLTLHDLTWLEAPDLCFDERLAWAKARVTHLYARLTMPYAARRAERVIAVSAHTRARGIATLGLDPAHVAVVHHGVERELFPPGPDASGASRDEGPDGFFLCLGNTKPYKNTRAAIEALACIASDLPKVRLLVTGRGDSRRNLERVARALGLRERVVFTGAVAHDRLLSLMHDAIGLVFPSIVEGFGFPLVEAMSAGCPIIGSSAPTVAEIAGEAALLPDPHRPEEIAEAMRRFATDESLRQKLRDRGLARVNSFSWDACARKTLAVYREVLPRPGVASA